MINWIVSNIPWIFSGIGVFIIGLFIYKNGKQKKNRQVIKKNSTGIQAGRDIKIKGK